MKKYILFLLTIYAFPVFCQVSFPDSNAIWNVNTVSSTGTPSGEILYGLEGDTLINDTLYHKLYLLADTTLKSKNLKEYLGGFRQEAQKVYFKPEYGNVMEFLLYDFAKQIGDTVWYNASLYISYNGEHSFEGDNKFNIVQDIIVESNHKRFIFYCDYNKQDECITGIGSIHGPFGPIVQIPLSGNSYHLACFKHNDTVKYSNNLMCNKCFCSGLTSIDEKKNNIDGILVFPNPVQNFLSIIIDKPYNNICVELIDKKGSIIYCKESLDNPININNTLRGIYFIKLIIDNEKIIRKVIIE